MASGANKSVIYMYIHKRGMILYEYMGIYIDIRYRDPVVQSHRSDSYAHIRSFAYSMGMTDFKRCTAQKDLRESSVE